MLNIGQHAVLLLVAVIKHNARGSRHRWRYRGRGLA
jgi:hypothetical protein